MRLYHRTSAAKEILRDGFKDAEATTTPSDDLNGVWVSDSHIDGNDASLGDTLLMVEVPDEEVEEYEWIETGKPYREFLVPARVLNRFGPPLLVMEEED